MSAGNIRTICDGHGGMYSVVLAKPSDFIRIPSSVVVAE